FSQARPCIRYFNDGRFIVSWESWSNSQAYDVYAQAFNKDGAKINGELHVNTTGTDNQWFSNIAVNSDNSFTILWCSWEQDGDDGGIFLQRFKPDLSKSGGEVRVNATTKYYQWLPKAKYMQDGKLAVVWSSWQTDQSREGVYYAVLDSANRLLTKERRGNDYTESFQWEPDIMVSNEGNLVLLWSTWGEYKKDYDVVGKSLTPIYPEEVVKPSALGHPEGQSSTELIVHVLDKTKLNGHTYEASFDTVSGKYLRMNIKDVTKGASAVNSLPLSLGENVFYMTDEFDGLSVELKPRFRLDLDTLSAHVNPSSKTNIRFTAALPKVGSPILSPVDAAIIWGKTDTLSGGGYASPSDTALNASAKKVVLVPFKAWSITQNKKLDLLVMENTATKNNRWDSGETILILTPVEYRKTALNTHAQLTSFPTAQSVIMPSEGDTMFIRTLKPLSSNDKYTFTALKENLTLDVSESAINPKKFVLEQNYPNPFNPSTTIRFIMAEDGMAELKIYDMLGREVKTIIEGFLRSGMHSFIWNGFNSNGTPAASGIYIYRLRTAGNTQSKKMILTK
ncbi:MAG: T9SS type A sorting domain-containing protein, partial [Syntrophothermus sp.]